MPRLDDWLTAVFNVADSHFGPMSELEFSLSAYEAVFIEVCFCVGIDPCFAECYW